MVLAITTNKHSQNMYNIRKSLAFHISSRITMSCIKSQNSIHQACIKKYNMYHKLNIGKALAQRKI